jgi:cellulose synthase operon protein C
MELTAADLAPIRDLYFQGLYRQAWAASERHGPLREWSNPAARLLAGRLMMQLGAPRTGRQLHLLAVRQSPTYPEAIYYHARYRLENYGPLSCWRYVSQHQDWSIAAPELRGDWLALQGLMWGRLRDFDRAEKFLAQAETQAADRAWLQVERASVYEVADKIEESLAAARRSLEVQPWFRPGVQAVAHGLNRLGRVREAVEFLQEAAQHLESGAILAQLAALHYDRGEYLEAQRCYDKYESLSPLMETEVTKWLAARRADVCYLLQDLQSAKSLALQVDDEFYKPFAQALENGPNEPYRKVLAVDFGGLKGSTLPTAQEVLARFWKQEVPKQPGEVANVSDGLPDSGDRQRWEQAGWSVREFRFDLIAVQKLIEAGIPFLLTLVEAGFSQHRLVVGYDRLRQTVSMAEAFDRRINEAPVKTLLQRYSPFGPRCLAVAPAEFPWPEFPWPEQQAYDELHELQVLLAKNKFSAAKDFLAKIQAERPDDRLTRFAELAWARATAHPVLIHEALLRLRKLYPEDNTFVLAEAGVLRELGRMTERTSLLQAFADRPKADPLLIQSAAQMLLPNPGLQLEADRLLRSSLKARPQAAAGYFLLASLWWEQQRFAEATELYRMATCADDREDSFAEAYSRATRVMHQAPEALRLFQQRAYRQAVPYPAAIRALFQALLDRDEPQQAFAAVGKAIDKAVAEATKPDPEADAAGHLAELLLFRAEQQSNFGRPMLAEADLASAKPFALPTVWCKSAARVARSKPDFATALEHLKTYLEHDPLSAEAHRLTATLLMDTAGRAAASRYLGEVCTRYPFSYSLLRYRAEFQYPDPGEAPIRATQDLIELCPRDAWAHRQLALIHADRKAHTEALAAVEQAGQFEPDHPSQFAVLAHVYRRADRMSEAQSTFRRGITLHPDHELAIAEMVQFSRGIKEKKASLQFIAEVLHNKPHIGDGLVAYFEQSIRLMEEPEDQEKLLVVLEQFLDERPDLWQSWSVVCQLLLMAHRAEESASLAKQATERFPLVPRVWIDLAEASSAANRPEERIEALRQAVLVAPGWTPAVREYAEALGEAEQYDEAIRVLERLVARSPLDPLAHWYLAERLWDADRSREALDRAKLSVRMDTGVDPRAEIAWSAVMSWSDRLDAPEEAVDLARAIAGDRAGDPQAWLRLARCLTEFSQSDEALHALDTAIRLDPRNVEAYDMKAERLAALGHYEAALETAQPSEFVGDMPLLLQGRAAWIEARRGNLSSAISQMQALVAIDPDYIWGWQQLAEWYNATNQPQSYLQAANELIRLRPDHPLSLTLRGEARLLNEQREEGKSDLREALKLSPNYSPAAAILFDACLEDDEVREARTALAVLQEHMAGSEVLLKQLQFAQHIEDTEAAERAFEDICLIAGEGPPHSLQAALQVMEELNLQAEAAKIMKEAWQSGEPFNPWVVMLWVDMPTVLQEDNLEEQLAGLEALVKQYPNFLPGLDRRAEQLANDGRFDEARAACLAGDHPELVPIALQGRMAWIEAQDGDKSKAIAQMQKLLAQNPDYSWGWRQLTYWFDELGRHQECLEAANNLVRLNPGDAVAYAIRGESKRLLGDHRGAKGDYLRAFELDPSFEAAGLQLVTAQLVTDELAEAGRTIEKLREHSNSPLLKLQQIQLSSRQGHLEEAIGFFRELLAQSRVARSTLREASLVMGQAGWEAEVEQELNRQLQLPECSGTTAGLWVERSMLAAKPHLVLDQLPSLTSRNPVAAREAILTYAWGQLPTEPSGAVSILQQYADVLRSDSESWGRAGGILCEAKHYSLTIAWLADWRERDDVQPWMLRPLADAYRAEGQDTEAEAVTRAAVDIDTVDIVPLEFLAWLALTDAVAGNTTEAEKWLEELGTIGLPDGVKLLASMAESLVLLQLASPDDKAKSFAEAKDHLLTAVGACAAEDRPPGTRRWYQKVTQRLAADAGQFTATLWAWWQKFRPAL